MSQYDFGNLESPLSGTAFFNTHLEPWRDALHSMHKGSTRPSYAVAGMMWVDDTTEPWILKMFNGTANDITLGTIDPTNFWFKPTGTSIWGGSAGGTANAITLTPTIPLTAYAAGVVYECLITATNTSETVTVNVSALGTKNVKASIGVGKVNIPIGGLQNGMIARFVYDGTDFLLLNVRAYNKGADIATAGTVNLDSATGDYLSLTGTTTVTAITLAVGQERTCHCGGAFILTHGASLILPGAANITTVAGDVFVVRGEAAGVVRVVNYMRASGAPLVGVTAGSQAEIEAETSGKFADAALMKYHPGVAKAYCKANISAAIQGTAYGVSSITDGGTGNFTVNWTTAFSSANYPVAHGILTDGSGAVTRTTIINSQAAGSVNLLTVNTGAAGATESAVSCFYITAFGDL